MSEPAKQPWYKRPLSGRFPGWLIFCLVMSAAVAFLGYMGSTVPHDPGPGIRGAIGGALIGFPIGILFLLAWQRKLAQAKQGAQELPEHFVPPAWLCAPVLVAYLVFVGYIMVNQRNGSLQPVLGMLFIAASLAVGFRLIAHEPRRWSTLATGVVCLLMSVAALIVATIRLFS